MTIIFGTYSIVNTGKTYLILLTGPICFVTIVYNGGFDCGAFILQ